MLKGTFIIAACLCSSLGCASARTEPADQPQAVWSQTTQTRTEVITLPESGGQRTYVAGCSRPSGGTGSVEGGVDVVYETPETVQALAASGITTSPTGIVGRDFRLEPLACDGVQTTRFILRGSRMAPDGWHVRIIRANSDCSADLAVVQNGVVTNTLPGAGTRACRTMVR